MHPKPKPLQVPEVSLVPLDGSAIVEMVHDGARTAYAVYRKGVVSIEESYPKDDHARFVPYRAINNIIRNQVVLFAEGALEYGSEAELLDEVRWYIHRYVDLSPQFERIAATFVMLSWVYDRFKELPYLRVKGDYGSGKTRFLLVVGGICYKPTFASGASTVSPIFHLLDSFKGTLIIDEADFRWSDEKAEIVKLLNNGNMRGMPVLRTRISPDKEYNPRAFSVFGPKIVASRGTYDDRALESRFLTHEMGTSPLRADIPISLPAVQEREAATLRNKLLMYRFRNLHRISTKPHFFGGKIDPRLKQIFVPLMSVVDDLDFVAELENLAREYSRQIATDRGFEIEAQILTAIKATQSVACGIALKDITCTFIRLYGEEFDTTITSRWIGSMVRRKLALRTHKSNGIYVIPPEEEPRLASLYEKYLTEDVTLVAANNDLPTIQA